LVRREVQVRRVGGIDGIGRIGGSGRENAVYGNQWQQA
jgi:hypothetical protein